MKRREKVREKGTRVIKTDERQHTNGENRPQKGRVKQLRRYRHNEN